ncbi:hypothetical protein [Brevibacterium sp. RIT 803]|uniref:hypothetical protein n=1 Tax=Brevibacterium sp. RIT 803 TaxID=2810210 RepID=UPI00194F1CE2|nr:hypothetical protein [Brevibacterium sp. RIT 803]MBM6590237.1 hypothetical protein [Brevibacterium sp. RIT 803]
MDADEGRATTTRLASTLSFIGGAWLNRKYTRLVSSLILAVIPLVVFYSIVDFEDWSAGFDPAAGFNRLVDDLNLVGVLTGISLFVFYPLAREIYFRTTQPMAEALAGLRVIGLPLVILVYLVKIWLYLIVWLVSIPLGILGFFYLAITEASGNGYRMA